jgi:hypothetical protein
MDPYLEVAAHWPTVHHRLLSVIEQTLADALAPAFIVTVEERVYVATPDEILHLPWFQPDVFLVSAAAPTPEWASSMTITPPLLIAPIDAEEVREYYLEIVDVETRAVVTTIEVLSPTNKAAGTTGRTKFLEKRRRVLASRTHWIEIDLLRAGERPPEAQGRGDYYALLHRGDEGAQYEVWPMQLRERLPVIAVPARAPLPDTPLDLQMIVNSVYRRGHYEIAIKYDAPVPPPPLAPDDARWAAQRIAAWRNQRSGTATGDEPASRSVPIRRDQ